MQFILPFNSWLSWHDKCSIAAAAAVTDVAFAWLNDYIIIRIDWVGSNARRFIKLIKNRLQFTTTTECVNSHMNFNWKITCSSHSIKQSYRIDNNEKMNEKKNLSVWFWTALRLVYRFHFCTLNWNLKKKHFFHKWIILYSNVRLSVCCKMPRFPGNWCPMHHHDSINTW